MLGWGDARLAVFMDCGCELPLRCHGDGMASSFTEAPLARDGTDLMGGDAVDDRVPACGTCPINLTISVAAIVTVAVTVPSA